MFVKVIGHNMRARFFGTQCSCSVWWTLLPAPFATIGSSIAACRGYCTTNSIGLMSPTEYNSSSPCWCIDVFTEQLRSTWWTVAHKQPTSSVVNICGPPVSGRWSFRVIDWTVVSRWLLQRRIGRVAKGHNRQVAACDVLMLRAHRPGIRCQTVFVIQFWVSAFSGVTWKLTYCEKLTRRRLRIREFFYRAMHFSAKRGIAIACRLSVRPSVCDVGELWSHRLEFFKNNFTVS